MNKTFSLSGLPLAIAGVVIREFAEGSDVVALDFANEPWEMQQDYLSSIAIEKPCRKATLTVKLAQGAPENEQLYQKHLACLAGGRPWIPVSFFDANGTSYLTCQGIFGKVPKQGFGTAASPLEWTFTLDVPVEAFNLGQNL